MDSVIQNCVAKIEEVLNRSRKRTFVSRMSKRLSKFESAVLDWSEKKFEDTFVIGKKVVEDLDKRMGMKVQETFTSVLAEFNQGLTSKQALLVWLAIMCSGELDGMVQNEKYYECAFVEELFFQVTNVFLSTFAEIFLGTLPSET